MDEWESLRKHYETELAKAGRAANRRLAEILSEPIVLSPDWRPLSVRTGSRWTQLKWRLGLPWRDGLIRSMWRRLRRWL